MGYTFSNLVAAVMVLGSSQSHSLVPERDLQVLGMSILLVYFCYASSAVQLVCRSVQQTCSLRTGLSQCMANWWPDLFFLRSDRKCCMPMIRLLHGRSKRLNPIKSFSGGWVLCQWYAPQQRRWHTSTRSEVWCCAVLMPEFLALSSSDGICGTLHKSIMLSYRSTD